MNICLTSILCVRILLLTILINTYAIHLHNNIQNLLNQRCIFAFLRRCWYYVCRERFTRISVGVAPVYDRNLSSFTLLHPLRLHLHFYIYHKRVPPHVCSVFHKILVPFAFDKNSCLLISSFVLRRKTTKDWKNKKKRMVYKYHQVYRTFTSSKFLNWNWRMKKLWIAIRFNYYDNFFR